MRCYFYLSLIIISTCLCKVGIAQNWINDKHKATIEATDNIKDNTAAYKTLDSLKKLPTLSPRSKVETLQRLAMVAVKMQKLDQAAICCFEGIDIAAIHHFDTAHCTFYKTIGSISYYSSKYADAISYFSKSASLAQKNGILFLEVNSYQNMGAVFIDFKKNDSAEFYLKKAITLSKTCGTKCNVYKITANRLLATLYERQKKYQLSLELYNAGIKEAIQLNDTTVICSYLIFSAELYAKINNPQKAISNTEEAIKLMQQHTGRNEHSYQFAINFLSKKLFEVGRYKEAYLAKSNALQLQNTIANKESKEQLNELQIKFKVKELEQEKNLANAIVIVEKQKKKTLYTILTGTILTAALILFSLYQRNKKKQAVQKVLSQKALLQSILETEEKERSRIAKDLHDGIVQDLTAIKLNLKATIKTSPETLEKELVNIFNDIDKTSKEVREISYQMMPVTLKELGLQKALQELCNRSLSKNNITYDCECIGIEQRLSEKIEVTVYRICQELINNTIKHSGANHISLLLQLRNSLLQLTYEDNGKGFNTSTANKGIGLNSLGSRLEMVNGKIEFDDTVQTGIAAYIRIPI